MESVPGGRPVAFLIRVQRYNNGLRGQVVAVATGAGRLFEDLREAMQFIKDEVRNESKDVGRDEG